MMELSKKQKGTALQKLPSIYIVIVVLIAVVIYIYLRNRPETLGNMRHSYTTPITTTSDISFFAKAGGRIKFSFRSDVESGNLDVILYNSEGNEVYKLDSARALETYFTIDNSDVYTLAGECTDFVGKYRITVCNAD